MYLLRADGSVHSKRQGWLFANFGGDRVMPGDAIVVPEQLDKFSFTRELKDWSQILAQFGIGIAASKVLKGF